MDALARIRQLIAASGAASAREFALAADIDPGRLAEVLEGRRRFTSLDVALVAEHCRTTVPWILTGADTELRVIVCRMPPNAGV